MLHDDIVMLSFKSSSMRPEIQIIYCTKASVLKNFYRALKDMYKEKYA